MPVSVFVPTFGGTGIYVTEAVKDSAELTETALDDPCNDLPPSPAEHWSGLDPDFGCAGISLFQPGGGGSMAAFDDDSTAMVSNGWVFRLSPNGSVEKIIKHPEGSAAADSWVGPLATYGTRDACNGPWFTRTRIRDGAKATGVHVQRSGRIVAGGEAVAARSGPESYEYSAALVGRHQSPHGGRHGGRLIGALVALLLSLGYTKQAQRAKALERTGGPLPRRRVR